MNIGVAGGWDTKTRCPYVSVQVYGERDGSCVTPEQIGKAYGALRRVVDLALETDPWAEFDWKVSWRPPEPRGDGGLFRATWLIAVACRVSSGDVMEGGPLHRLRATEVARVMRSALDAIVLPLMRS